MGDWSNYHLYIGKQFHVNNSISPGRQLIQLFCLYSVQQRLSETEFCRSDDLFGSPVLSLSLLPGHHAPVLLFLWFEVADVIIFQVDTNPVDLAGELVALALGIVISDWQSQITADVQSLIDCPCFLYIDKYSTISRYSKISSPLPLITPFRPTGRARHRLVK